MVQHMIDKFNEYKLVNSGSTMTSGEKQQPVSVKKVALRELPSETTNIMAKPPGSSPVSKDKGMNVDFLKVLGAKRQLPDSPVSPSSQHPMGNTGANGHLVYVRRKLDTEASKVSSSDNAGLAGSPDTRKFVDAITTESKVHRDQIQEPKASLSVHISVPACSQSTSSGVPSLSYSLGKASIGLPVPEPNDSMVTTVSPLCLDTQQPGAQHWRERFLRLQMFLKHCDQSSQEEYINMLRSLPAVGRSKHAVELEKRAIQLMLEEGKELHRMKVLNVLGKALPKDDASVSTQTLPTLELEGNEKTVDAAKLSPLTS